MSGIVAGKAHNGFVVIRLSLMPYQVNITYHIVFDAIDRVIV